MQSSSLPSTFSSSPLTFGSPDGRHSLHTGMNETRCGTSTKLVADKQGWINDKGAEVCFNVSAPWWTVQALFFYRQLCTCCVCFKMGSDGIKGGLHIIRSKIKMDNAAPLLASASSIVLQLDVFGLFHPTSTLNRLPILRLFSAFGATLSCG